MRTNRALSNPIGALNLQFLIADLLEEQRDKSSMVSKALSYRASNSSKESTHRGSKENKTSKNPNNKDKKKNP